MTCKAYPLEAARLMIEQPEVLSEGRTLWVLKYLYRD